MSTFAREIPSIPRHVVIGKKQRKEVLYFAIWVTQVIGERKKSRKTKTKKHLGAIDMMAPLLVGQPRQLRVVCPSLPAVEGSLVQRRALDCRSRVDGPAVGKQEAQLGLALKFGACKKARQDRRKVGESAG